MEVVVARIRFSLPAGAVAIGAGVGAAVAACVAGTTLADGDAAEPQAAATRTSVMSGAIRSNTPRFEITEPGAIAIPPRICRELTRIERARMVRIECRAGDRTA